MEAKKSRAFACLRLLLVVSLVAGSLPAGAVQLPSSNSDFSGNFDTTISVGGVWRASDPDKKLIGVRNGGTSRSVNEDDGDLMYKKDELVYNPVKVTHDLELKYQNYGFFGRGTYFYDFAVQREKNNMGSAAEDRLLFDARFLDLYVYGNWDVLGRPLNARVGQQVLNWGESTFIPNGLNSVNSVDVNRLRIPGSELKEALLPTPMFFASQGITQNLSVEGFYLDRWDRIRLDPRGTYFSSNDYVTDDGNRVFMGFGRRNDMNQTLVPPVGGTAAVAQVWAPRRGDRSAKNDGQYGFAARHLFPGLNNTEISVYGMNYHSRIPIATGVRGTSSNSLVPGTAYYFAEYPEDIKLYGLGFNTQLPGGIAMQGEYSYRPNLPVQVAGTELLLAALGAGPNQVTGGTVAAFLVPAGTEISGYRRLKYSQAQATFTKAFGPTLKSEQWILLGEVGGNYFHNLPDNLNFNGPAAFLPAPGSNNTTSGSYGSNQDGGYLTKTAWGYRVATRMDYTNLIPRGTVSPKLTYYHDVRGVGPSFTESVQSLTPGLTIDYKQAWRLDLTYTNYFGGKTFSGTDPNAGGGTYSSLANPLADRDFYSASLSYSF